MATKPEDIQAPSSDINLFAPTVDTAQVKLASDFTTFPYMDSLTRLANYGYYENLFIGDHFSAFNIKIDNENYGRDYSRLRYVKANFAGLISKVIADFLFSEPVVITVPDGDQEFIDALIRENKLDQQFYESGLSNSYFGDALFKLRVGKREPNDSESTVIIEDITPTIYFPKIDPFNVKANPAERELAWVFEMNKKKYVRKEIHRVGSIENQLWELQGNKIVAKVPVSILGLPEFVSTGIEFPLLYHIPNWKTGNRHFGISDYYDMDSLFYAINNRLTKVDNILDKHSDPILMVPPGILDEHGQIKKKALGVIEVKEGEDNRPEYIVWDASLENAFKEIERLIDLTFMTSEISLDAFAMGKGQSDSGRALKFKLLRTIAKAARKKLYYDSGIKNMLFTAQVLAKKWNLKVGGKTLQGEPTPVEIKWNDGIPVDELEQVEVESKKIDTGIQSKKEAIMNIEQIDEESADEKLTEIEDEKPDIEIQGMDLGMNNGMKNGDMKNKKMGMMNK